MDETPNTKPAKRNDLWWDVLLVLIFHSILFVIFLLLLWFIFPLIGTFLSEFAVSLPWTTQQLFQASSFMRHPLLLCVATIIALWIDGKVYRWLCVTRGKKAGTLYGIGVGIIIFLAILWFGVLFGISMCTIGDGVQSWRMQTRAEQGAASQER